MRHRRNQQDGSADRRRFIDLIGADVVRFQDGSAAFDELAARILALEGRDLPVLTMLLYGGPVSVDAIAAALHVPRSAIVLTRDRLELAGYVRRRSMSRENQIEVTEHARRWIRLLWEPLRRDGGILLDTYSANELATMSAFMSRVCAIQERHLRRLRRWLAVPTARARRAHLRGGLAPAALQRVQVFVESNLDQKIRLADLAGRAGLSRYHFARAFRVATGMTPRKFIEERRVQRAKELISNTEDRLVDIALQTGLGTQSRLTALLKKRTGFTPAEFRRGRPAPPAESR